MNFSKHFNQEDSSAEEEAMSVIERMIADALQSVEEADSLPPTQLSIQETRARFEELYGDHKSYLKNVVEPESADYANLFIKAIHQHLEKNPKETHPSVIALGGVQVATNMIQTVLQSSFEASDVSGIRLRALELAQEISGNMEKERYSGSAYENISQTLALFAILAHQLSQFTVFSEAEYIRSNGRKD